MARLHFVHSLRYFVKTAAKPAGEYLKFGIVGFLAASLRKLDYTQKKYFDKRRTRDKTI